MIQISIFAIFARSPHFLLSHLHFISSQLNSFLYNNHFFEREREKREQKIEEDDERKRKHTEMISHFFSTTLQFEIANIHARFCCFRVCVRFFSACVSRISAMCSFSCIYSGFNCAFMLTFSVFLRAMNVLFSQAISCL